MRRRMGRYRFRACCCCWRSRVRLGGRRIEGVVVVELMRRRSALVVCRYRVNTVDVVASFPFAPAIVGLISTMTVCWTADFRHPAVDRMTSEDIDVQSEPTSADCNYTVERTMVSSYIPTRSYIHFRDQLQYLGVQNAARQQTTKGRSHDDTIRLLLRTCSVEGPFASLATALLQLALPLRRASSLRIALLL